MVRSPAGARRGHARRQDWAPRIGRLGNQPGRCWRLHWRDRLAWRLFVTVANNNVAHVVWHDYRKCRDCLEVRWIFPNTATLTDKRQPRLELSDDGGRGAR